jgi:hypothetical protein
MSVRDNDSVVNVNKTKPEDVVSDEENIAIGFIRIELEDEDGGVVGVHEHQELDLISHCLLRCEHVSTVSSTEASHGGPRDTFLLDILLPSSARAPVQLNWAELAILSLLNIHPPSHPG